MLQLYFALVCYPISFDQGRKSQEPPQRHGTAAERKDFGNGPLRHPCETSGVSGVVWGLRRHEVGPVRFLRDVHVESNVSQVPTGQGI